MKAAVINKPGELQIKDVPVPVPGSGEVRVAVKLAGVCGSDNSMYHGKLMGAFPVIAGHEAVGTVDQLGAQTSGFALGQRVTIHPNYWCGTCDLCQKGLTNICRAKVRLGVDIDGVFTNYVVVPEQALYPVPEDLPDEVAVFTEPLSVSTHAVKLSGLKVADRVLVFGAGVIGQLTLQLALQTAKDVTVCDLIEPRLELARRTGAARTLSDKEEIAASENSFDVIFETSGAPSALAQAIQLAAPGATIVLLGLPGQDHPVSTVQIVRKELKIRGSMIYTDEFPESIALLKQGAIDTEALVSSRITINELADNLENFSAPERMKTLVEIEPE